MTVLTACSATMAEDTVPPLPCITSRSLVKPLRAQLAAQALDVAGEYRLHRGVDAGGGAALVFAVLGQDQCPAVR